MDGRSQTAQWDGSGNIEPLMTKCPPYPDGSPRQHSVKALDTGAIEPGPKRNGVHDAIIPGGEGWLGIGGSTVEALHQFIEIGIVLAAIGGAVAAYFRFRGRHFGWPDLAIFGSLAIAADVLTYLLVQVVAGPHGESSAYGALAALLLLLGLVPVVAGVNIVGVTALVVCLVRHRSLRIGVLVLALVAGLGHRFLDTVDAMSAPGGALNSDKLAGEHWALESGASSKQDCDRQSQAKAFREGCYGRLNR